MPDYYVFPHFKVFREMLDTLEGFIYHSEIQGKIREKAKELQRLIGEHIDQESKNFIEFIKDKEDVKFF